MAGRGLFEYFVVVSLRRSPPGTPTSRGSPTSFPRSTLLPWPLPFRLAHPVPAMRPTSLPSPECGSLELGGREVVGLVAVFGRMKRVESSL